MAEPAHAGPDTFTVEAAPDGRRASRARRRPVSTPPRPALPLGSGTPRCTRQPRAGPPRASSRSASSSLEAGSAPGTGGPDDDLALGPRRLQRAAVLLDELVVVVVVLRLVVEAVQAVIHPAQAFELVREIGDDLLPLRAGQPVNRLEPSLRVSEQTVEHPRGQRGIGVDQGEIGGRGAFLCGCPDRSLEGISFAGLVQSEALLAPDSDVNSTSRRPRRHRRVVRIVNPLTAVNSGTPDTSVTPFSSRLCHPPRRLPPRRRRQPRRSWRGA